MILFTDVSTNPTCAMEYVIVDGHVRMKTIAVRLPYVYTIFMNERCKYSVLSYPASDWSSLFVCGRVTGDVTNVRLIRNEFVCDRSNDCKNSMIGHDEDFCGKIFFLN